VREVSLNSRERGAAAAGALLDAPDPPTALLCMSDELAIGALRAAAARGRRLAVVGWDDTPEAERAQLTTIHQSLRDHGRLCAQLAVATEPAAGVQLQPWELVVRASTSRGRS
jgi:DNA-binding LacI/PurR family transcriptional regulator